MKSDMKPSDTNGKCRRVSDFSIAILINVCVLVLCVFVCKPFFETNDDLAMAQIASGARFAPDSHIVFINIIVGKVLSELYILFPNGLWYVWVQWFAIFCALTVVTYVFIRKAKNKAVLYPLIAVLLGMGYECYVILQFTKTATIASATGAILIFYGIENKHKYYKIIEVLLGSFLVIVGALYRFSAFEMVILVMLGIGVFRLEQLWDKDVRNFIRNALPYIASFGCVILVAFMLEWVDVNAYLDDGEWETYTEFNDLRADLLDYGFPDFNQNAKLYVSFGMSERDADYYSRWQYGDTENFTTEMMRELVAAKGEGENPLKNKELFWGNYIEKLVAFGNLGIFWVFVLIQVCFVCQDKKRGIYVLLYELVQTCMVYFYFVYIGRYGQRRIDASYWMIVILVVFFLLLDKQWRIQKTSVKRVVMLASVLGISVINIAGMWRNITKETDIQAESEAKLFFEEVAKDDEHLYLATAGSSLESIAWGLNDKISRGCLNNFYSVGGWQNRSPITNRVLQAYNIDNPYRQVIDNEAVYFVDNILPDITERYLQENYGEDVDLALVKYALGCYIFRVYQEGPIIDTSSILDADGAVIYEVNVEQYEEGTYVTGYAYKEGTSSFAQNTYVEIINEEGEREYRTAVLLENEMLDDIYSGRFSRIDQHLQGVDTDGVTGIILETEGMLYRIAVEN